MLPQSSVNKTIALTFILAFGVSMLMQEPDALNYWYINIWVGLVASLAHGALCTAIARTSYPWWNITVEVDRDRLVNRALYLSSVLQKAQVRTHIPIATLAKEADYITHTFRQSVMDYTNDELVESIARLKCECVHVGIMPR